MHRTLEHHELGDRRILIVDDEPLNVQVLTRMLRGNSLTRIRSTSDSREAMHHFRDFQPDLVLLDLRMPHLDGFEILAALQVEVPVDQYLPVLVLTGDLSSEVRERALLAGARDFITKPFDMTEVLLRIRNLLETRALHLRLQDHAETLEHRVRERTQELAEAHREILRRLALAAEYRDDVTGKHAERVGLLSALLGREIGLDDREVHRLRRAATLHDVGKIGVPDAILLKPGALTRDEFEVMKSHTEIGGRILSGGRFPLLDMAREVALCHHEKWDGSGYGKGRAGEDIPIVGRLVAVADVFDSLTHERPYKDASPMEVAVEAIRAGAGSHFDPKVVEAFMRLMDRGEVAELDDRVRAFEANGGSEWASLPFLPGVQAGEGRPGSVGSGNGESSSRPGNDLDPRDPPRSSE